MAKVETEKLTGAALDWAVSIATGLKPGDLYINNGGGKQYIYIFRKTRDEDGNLTGHYMTGPDLLFSSKWEAAGPLIERERISLLYLYDKWGAGNREETNQYGSTPLIAAMRCYVASKLGDKVEIPNKLMELMK